jgi:16S rRNA processing protein RimM
VIHNLVKVGYLIKAFGKSGYLRVNLDKIHLNDIKIAGYLLVDIEGNKKPVFIEDYKEEEDLIKFDTIDGPYEARALSDIPVFLLDKDILTASKPEQISNQTIVGFNLFDQENNLIGSVKNIIDLPMQVLLEVELIVNKEDRLIPFHDSLLISFSSEDKTLHMHIVDGLLELK